MHQFVRNLPCRTMLVAALATASLVGAPLATGAEAQAGVTERMSVDSAGIQGDDHSFVPAISGNGRYVVFDSSATNLVAGDGNAVIDVFLRDRRTDQTTRVSIDSAGTEGNGDSWNAAVTTSGRYVAFNSNASNLVPNDTNLVGDVFVHDMKTGRTRRVSVGAGGAQGNLGSYVPALSSTGRYVAFESFASNLVAGDTNAESDVFVHDVRTGQTTRVSVGSTGTQGDGASDLSSISSNGRYVAFRSRATNLVAGDTNGSLDVFVHDTITGRTTRVSVDSAGTQANSDSYWPAISSDGRYVAFESSASNLVPGDTNSVRDVFVHDLTTGETTRVSVDSAGVQGNGNSYQAAIAGNGRYVAFGSLSSNLVPGDGNGEGDIFVHDMMTGETIRASVDSTGAEANGHSQAPELSMDGRQVVFASFATDLVPADTNGVLDVFVHEVE